MGALVASTGADSSAALADACTRCLEQHGGDHWRIGRVAAAGGRRFANRALARTRGQRAGVPRGELRPQPPGRLAPAKTAPAGPTTSGDGVAARLAAARRAASLADARLAHGPASALELEERPLHGERARSPPTDARASSSSRKTRSFAATRASSGYELWKAAIDRGHQILIRVGANVTLLRKLGYNVRERGGIVYCWPSAAARKSQPPLVLRLIRFRLGRTQACVVTSVLGASSTRRAAGRCGCTGLRWGVELQFAP